MGKQIPNVVFVWQKNNSRDISQYLDTRSWTPVTRSEPFFNKFFICFERVLNGAKHLRCRMRRFFVTSNVVRSKDFEINIRLRYQQTAHYTQHSKWLRRFLSLNGFLVKSAFGCDVVVANPTDRGHHGSKVSAIVHEHGLPVSFFFFLTRQIRQTSPSHCLP